MTRWQRIEAGAYTRPNGVGPEIHLWQFGPNAWRHSLMGFYAPHFKTMREALADADNERAAS